MKAAEETVEIRKSLRREGILTKVQKDKLNMTMRTRVTNQGMHESYMDRKDINSSILSQKGDTNEDSLVPAKVTAKPAAMTSLNFYSSKGTTARS
jgi:hypothetical protein